MPPTLKKINVYNRLPGDPGIIRNRSKIKGTIRNAQVFLDIQKESGSFDTYIWKFNVGKTIINHWIELNQIPAASAESDPMAKDLKKRGFTFCGSTIYCAFMLAAGMVNEHLEGCFRKSQAG